MKNMNLMIFHSEEEDGDDDDYLIAKFEDRRPTTMNQPPYQKIPTSIQFSPRLTWLVSKFLSDRRWTAISQVGFSGRFKGWCDWELSGGNVPPFWKGNCVDVPGRMCQPPRSQEKHQQIMLFKLVVLTICSSQSLGFLSEKFEHGWIMTSQRTLLN